METQPFTPQNPPPKASNGHVNSRDLHYYSQRDNDRETTRYLSAATQIDLHYARRVVDRVIYEPYRALAPAHGADVTVVARWALDSLHRIALRDAGLTITLIAGVLLSWLFAAVVQASPWVVLATVLVMLGVAFFCIAHEYWVRWYRILAEQMLREGFDPERAPQPAAERVQQRLQAAADRKSGNLVVFGGQAAFTGSGSLVGQEQIVIDASRGKQSDGDSPSEPIPFSNTDVHVAIAAAIRDIKLPGLNVVERVFVNGKHVRGNGELQERSLDPPFASVTSELLRSAAEHPTADARTYVCAEIHGWQGQLVVTMFARAVHAGGWLYIEYSFYLLPPIDAAYTRVDSLYIEPLGQRVRRTWAWSAARTIPYLLASPFSLIKQGSKVLLWNARESTQGYLIYRGQSFDYGALRSIREDACLRGSSHYFIQRDITMYVLLLQKSLLREMGKFLNDHNIATADFEEQAKVIIDASYKNYSVHIGKVSDSNFAVGDNANAGSDKKNDSSG
ncbi:MAG TPA: hypothetical protein VHZ03_04365 [Trebonia sp.]|jgi:hypothetical protein|nr:hypothetical protein [Trebonia sp.]